MPSPLSFLAFIPHLPRMPFQGWNLEQGLGIERKCLALCLKSCTRDENLRKKQLRKRKFGKEKKEQTRRLRWSLPSSFSCALKSHSSGILISHIARSFVPWNHSQTWILFFLFYAMIEKKNCQRKPPIKLQHLKLLDCNSSSVTYAVGLR